MAATNTSQDYQSFVEPVRKFLLFAGLWPVKQPNPFYRLLPTLMFAVTLSSSFLIINFIVAHRSNILIMTQGLGSAVTFITLTLKTFYCDPSRKCVKTLYETLDPVTDELMNDTALKNLVSGKVSIARKLSSALSCLILSSCIAYLLTPIVYIIYQHVHDIHPFKYRLVMPAKYPWSFSGGSFLYYCQYLFELVGFFNCFVVSAGVDNYFMVCVIQMSWKFRAMSYQFSNLGHNDNYDAAVHECITGYRMLLRCRDNIEKMYGPLILWIFVSGAVILCAIVFQLSKIQSFSIVRILFFALYMGARLLQLFIYTWSGTMLTLESEKFRDAIYSSSWPGTGQRRFMSSILIMLTQKPLIISACSFATVSIEMFPKTVNTAISYFFLLRTMEGKGT